MCNNSFIIESVEKKKGKEMKKERKTKEKSVARTWLDLNSVPLGSVLRGAYT